MNEASYPTMDDPGPAAGRAPDDVVVGEGDAGTIADGAVVTDNIDGLEEVSYMYDESHHISRQNTLLETYISCLRRGTRTKSS